MPKRGKKSKGARRSDARYLAFSETVLTTVSAGGTATLVGDNLSRLPSGVVFRPTRVHWELAVKDGPALVQCALFSGGSTENTISRVFTLPANGKITINLSWLTNEPLPDNWDRKDKLAEIYHICYAKASPARVIGTLTVHGLYSTRAIPRVCPTFLKVTYPEALAPAASIATDLVTHPSGAHSSCGVGCDRMGSSRYPLLGSETPATTAGVSREGRTQEHVGACDDEVRLGLPLIVGSLSDLVLHEQSPGSCSSGPSPDFSEEFLEPLTLRKSGKPQ